MRSRGAPATGLLLTAILLWAALNPQAGNLTALGAIGLMAVAHRALFSWQRLRLALGEQADALELTVELGLALLTMALTGGVRSPLVVVPLGQLLLARWYLGPAAARTVAAQAVLGLALLVPFTPGLFWSRQVVLGVAFRVLWPVGILAAMELSRQGQGMGLAAPSSAPWASAARPAVGPVREMDSALLHDLKSPLSVVRVYADLIAERARRGELPPEDHLQNLAAELELMETLLESRRPSGRPSRPGDPTAAAPPTNGPTTDLVRVLGSLAEAYRLAHSATLRIEFMAEQPEVTVAAEPVALQRVFRNLLDNAVKFTPPGGQVRIRVREQGGQGVVLVSDTGAGLRPEERERAFEVAFRGRSAAGLPGQGLGLTVTRELVEANGGSISISSEQGLGSEVTVALPLAAAAAG